MKREKCLVCSSSSLKQIINLGLHPFADTFMPKSKFSEPDMIYPLICDLCENCGHVQTQYETNPLLRYSQIEYSYTSANSNFSRTHWEEYAEEISKDIELKQNALVIEIGSNDGYLSQQFMKKGARALGVDPSPYMAELAKQRGVTTIVNLFGEKVVGEILRDYGKASLIVANNVFNHADNPLDFVSAVEKLLSPEGSFIFEQPYWLDTLRSKKFDQIYHEHVSYFTVRSAAALLEKVGLVVKSAKVVNYHGGSLRIVAQKKGMLDSKPEQVRNMIKEEEDYGTFKLKTYEDFMSSISHSRNEFLQKLFKIKEEGNSIIAVGAAAKGNTFLNFYRLDNTILDFVTDSSPHKQGKFTPATRIPIVSDEIFSKYKKPYALILSWNIASQLKDILSKYNNNIEFIAPDY